MPVITRFEEVTPEWLTGVLGEVVTGIAVKTEESTWAKHARITATLEGGATKKLWLKVCLHAESGRSEVDYYTRDYVDLPNAPILKCYDSGYEPGVGYHLLFDDLSEEFHDRKVVPPTLDHGLAIAEAVARMHRHHWGKGAPKQVSDWEPQFAALREGVKNIEKATGRAFSERFEEHALELKERWSQPEGQTLLHGDINPTNVLTPKSADSPIYFLDRQPLDGQTVYGLALYDLAYAIAPWWPSALRNQHEEEILRCWFETLAVPSYSWSQATSDWHLSVEQCLHVPFDWCRDPNEMESMRWLWEWQLGNILSLVLPEPYPPSIESDGERSRLWTARDKKRR